MAGDCGVAWGRKGENGFRPAPKPAKHKGKEMHSRRLPRFLLGVLATAALQVHAGTYTANVPEGTTQTIDAAFVTALGTDDLVKTGRGTLVSSADMASYTGTITIREGAFEIRTTSDLGTAAGGTVVEDGGTLVVNMSTKDQSFGNEVFTIAGTGDATYGAAIYQSDYHANDQNKLFKYFVLSDDATISSGTHLGLASGTLTMNGHTLTVKGNGGFTFRHTQTPTPVGNLVSEIGALRFRGGSNYTGNPSQTLTVRNGSTLVLGYSGDNVPPIWWNLVVEEGGKVSAEASSSRNYYGDVAWNAMTENGVTGTLTFNGDVTGTGMIKSSSGNLTFVKPLGADVGLGLSGTATAALPPPNAYSYEHAGLMVGRYNKGDAWWEFNNNRVSEWKLCLEGPGPQIDQLYWTKGWWGDATGTEGDESIGGSWSLGAQGYMWNRESTNVTFHVWCRVLYKTYVAIGGSTCFVARNNNVDTDTEVTIPANSCVSFLAVTAGSGSGTPGLYNSTTGLKIVGGDVLRDSGNGWLFTTNPVSGIANPPVLANLALAGDGTLDMNNLPLSVAALSGAGLVTNVTTLTVSDSWSLAAADVIDGATLEVYGDVVFGNGATISVSNLRSLPVTQTYTICKADSIAGIASGTLITEQARVWKVVLSGDGTTLSIENVPQATVLYLR